MKGGHVLTFFSFFHDFSAIKYEHKSIKNQKCIFVAHLNMLKTNISADLPENVARVALETKRMLESEIADSKDRALRDREYYSTVHLSSRTVDVGQLFGKNMNPMINLFNICQIFFYI